MQKKKREKKREKKRVPTIFKNKKRLGNIIFFVIVGVMVFRGLMQIPRINQKAEELENLRHEKIYEEARAEEVEKMKNITDTDEYIEKMAREKLGLVREDEKIFIDVSKQDN